MATPTYATVISQIETYIVANANNEITANVLNPILKVITDFANNTIGELTDLTTTDTNTIVGAINSLKVAFENLQNNGIQLSTGYTDPNVTPPTSYNYGDFYMELDISDDSPIQLWQWNGTEWTTYTSVYTKAEIDYLLSNYYTKSELITQIGLLSSGENELIEKGFNHVINFDWFVFAQVYRFNGIVTENLVTDTITLDASPTTTDYKRFDVIVFNDDFTFSVVKGAEGLNPAIPKIDIKTQIQLTVILVEANTTDPSYVTKQLMYDEGVGLPTEFAVTKIGTTITIDSTEQASSGTKSIKVANPINSDVLFLDKNATFNSLDVDTITFKVKNVTAGNWRFHLYSYNSIDSFYQGTATIKNGSYGYNSNNITDWQTIIVPISKILGNGEIHNTGFALTFFNDSLGTFFFDEFALNGNFTEAPISSDCCDLKEDLSNKKTDIEANKTSNIFYAPIKAIYDWAVGIFQRKLIAGTNITIDETDPLNPIINAAGGGGIVINGEYVSNDDAIANGLVAGNVYKLPYLMPNGFYPLAVVGTVVINEQMKSILISSTSILTDYPIYLNVYNTVGTDTTSNIYLNGKVRADWGDIRILSANGDSIPFGIIKKEATVIKLVFAGSFAIGDNTFYIKYNKPQVSGNVTKFGITTDQHYDPAETYVNRHLALARLDNFKARMAIYLPDVILEGGDKHGAVTTTDATRLSNMQLVTNKHNEIATTLGVPNYIWGWGNHDFEYNSFASVQAQYNGLIGQVSGNLYATWSDANYTYISLDAQYSVGTDTHLSNSHTGVGYINPIQLTWLTNTLASATKPCIVFCHQLLGEADTEKFFLTKEIYHVQNRTAVRDILEASNKVVFVLTGHVHNTTHNIINGIPYLSLVDLNDPSSSTQHWDVPFTNLNGRWGTIEIDRSALIIRFRQEIQINSTVSTIYDFSIPYKTVFDIEYGDTSEKVFSLNYSGLYEKAAIISDATDMYVNDDLFVIVKPASIYDNEPRLSGNTIKIQALTSAPNYGRPRWDFSEQTSLFKCKFSFNQLAFADKNIRLQETGTTSISTYMSVKANGFIAINNVAVFTDVLAYTLNTWYDCEFTINMATKKYDLFINGVQYANQLNFYTASCTKNSQVEMVCQTGSMMLDNFRIEKYVTTQPSITAIGAEEINF